MKTCLDLGLPFIFGFIVYESFVEIGKDGIMKMPDPHGAILGGHAVAAVGYDDDMESKGAAAPFRAGEKGFMIIRNSWGTNWGDSGYCYMPYSFITDSKYCDDFWTVQKITNKKN